MSQYPPPPPPPPAYGAPPGYGAPPPGYGGSDPRMVPGQGKGNGWAITSLVMGIIGCFVLTSIGAIIFGALGVRKANKVPQAGGKGMSIVGIVLGVFWLAVVGGFSWAFFSGTSTQREVARSFVKAISAGDVSAAQEYVTSDVKPEQLAATVADVKSWGTLKDTTAVGVSVFAGRSETVTMVGLVAEYDKTAKRFECELIKEGDKWKVRKYSVQ